MSSGAARVAVGARGSSRAENAAAAALCHREGTRREIPVTSESGPTAMVPARLSSAAPRNGTASQPMRRRSRHPPSNHILKRQASGRPKIIGRSRPFIAAIHTRKPGVSRVVLQPSACRTDQFALLQNLLFPGRSAWALTSSTLRVSFGPGEHPVPAQRAA